MNIKEYIASQLNEEQTKAALYIDTPSLIIAGAGSWKTRVLTYKIANLIWGCEIPVNRILAVTFTNRAANEMRERLVKISEDIAWFGLHWNNVSSWAIAEDIKENNLYSSSTTPNDSKKNEESQPCHTRTWWLSNNSYSANHVAAASMAHPSDANTIESLELARSWQPRFTTFTDAHTCNHTACSTGGDFWATHW